MLNKHAYNMWWKHYDKKILVSVKELSDINFKNLEKSIAIHKNNLIDSDNNEYLTVHFSIDLSNIMINLNNITIRNVNVKSNWCDKMYMDKDVIVDKLYQLIDQFNKKKLK